MLRFCFLVFFSMSAAWSMQLASKNSVSTRSNSNLFLLFEQVLSNVDFNFDEDEHNIFIDGSRADEAAITKKMRKFLSSREGIHHYCYGSKCEPVNTSESSARFSDLKIGDAPAAVGLVKDLFGDIFLMQNFSRKAFTTGDAYFAHGKLFSRNFINSNRHALLGFHDALLSSLVERDVEDLRKAFSDPAFFLDAQDLEINDTSLVGLMCGCAFIASEKENNSRLCIDLERMHNLCFAPILENKIEDDRVIFTISKKHLVLHLRRLLVDTELLRYVQHQDRLFAEPLFLTEKLHLAKPPFVSFVIDRSGSLEPSFPDLIDSLKKSIDLIWTRDQNALVRVVFFADEREVIGNFGIKDRATLFAHVEKKSADGNTRLISTIKDEINYIQQANLLGNFSVSFVVFTDGHSNCGDTLSTCNLESCVQSVVHGKKRFTSYAMGFGEERNVDKETLATIANATFGTTIIFSQLEEFLGLLEKSIDCENEKKLEKFLIKLEETAKIEALMSVPQNQFGICRSNVFLNVNQVAGPKFEASAVLDASPEEINLIRLTQAYFYARELLADATKDTKSLVALHEILLQNHDNPEEDEAGRRKKTALIVDQFIAIVTKLRKGAITTKLAFEDLENIYRVFLR